MREVKKAASDASGDIQVDLQALRDDFARLADQVSAILSDKGSAAWKRARSSVDDVVAGAQGKGREAASAVRDVSDNFVEAKVEYYDLAGRLLKTQRVTKPQAVDAKAGRWFPLSREMTCTLPSWLPTATRRPSGESANSQICRVGGDIGSTSAVEMETDQRR